MDYYRKVRTQTPVDWIGLVPRPQMNWAVMSFCPYRLVRDESKLEAWVTTLKEDHQEPLSWPRVSGCSRWKKDIAKISSGPTQDHQAWIASIRDVANLIEDSGSARPAWTPPQIQFWTSVQWHENNHVSGDLNWANKCTSKSNLLLEMGLTSTETNSQCNDSCGSFAMLAYGYREKTCTSQRTRSRLNHV